MRIGIYILLAAFLVGITSTFAQVASVKATLQPKDILIGEHCKLTLEVTYPEELDPLSVSWPIFEDTSDAPAIENVNIESEVAKNKSNGQITLTKFYTITSFDSGLVNISGIPVLADQDTIFSNALSLNVRTVEVDTSEAIFDIKEILEEEYTWLDWLAEWWDWVKQHLVIVLLCFVAVGVLIFILLKRRAIKNLPPPPKPLIPAHTEAFEKLSLLQSKQLWQNGFYKEFYIELSDITRSYIERRYEVPALEHTTAEVLHFLRLIEMPDQSRSQLSILLKLSDLVKFAKENPLPHENEKAFQDAWNFIEQTKIEVVVPANTEEK